jgi:hypothetical protein
MEELRVRKTFKYKLIPTPEQERALEAVLWRCRELYNAGLQSMASQAGSPVPFSTQDPLAAYEARERPVCF